MTQTEEGLPKTLVDQLKNITRTEYNAGRLHYILLATTLIIDIIFYSFVNYEVYIFGGILFLGISFGFRESSSRYLRLMSVTFFLFIVLLDLTASVSILLLDTFDFKALITLIIDLLALGIFILFKVKHPSKK